MKKIYLSIIALVLLSSVKAQINDYNPNQSFKISESGLTSQKLPAHNKHEKVLGVTIWSDDFSDPSTWDIENNLGTTDQAADRGWNINATADGWKFKNPIVSASGGNFAELLNGDPNPVAPATVGSQALNVNYNLTTKDPIDIAALSGAKGNNVYLTFSQYGAKFNDAQIVCISTDGGVKWDTIGGNSNTPVNTYIGTTKRINLAPFLKGSFNSVKIRFSWTTAFPNLAANSNVWVAYGWMIDDVKIITNADNDLAQEKVLFGSRGAYANEKGDMGYYKIPVTQISRIDFGGVITNNGSSIESDIVFNAVSPPFVGLSLASPIAPGFTDTIWIDNEYEHDGTIGSKTFSFNTSTTSAIDDVPTNNSSTASSPITINFTEHIYARDNGIKDGNYDNLGEDNLGKEYELANVFDVFADQTLYSIDVTLDSKTATNTSVYGIIYELTQAGRVELDRSDVINVTSAMKGKNITLELSKPQLLSTGKPYLIGVGSAGGNGVDLVVATAGKSNPGTSFIKDENGKWLYISPTPMIRMNFQNTTGLSELKTVSSLNIYPNPANTSSNVSFELNNETDVNIAVSDLTGKTVYSNKLGNMNSGSHNVTINTDALSNGIYIVNFEANGTTTSQKLVVKK
jgi:hypothetical protein